MILWYKNSFWASVVSIFGCAFILAGIGMFGDDAASAIIAIICGVALAIWGKIISNNKAFKVWWKQIEEKNLEPQIAASTELAMMIYSKNPCKKTLAKIQALNPVAAEQIRQNQAKK